MSPLAAPPQDPPPASSYPLVLSAEPVRMRAMLGLLMSLSLFMLLLPLGQLVVLGVGFLMRGGGDFAAYRAAASAYRLPEGPAAGNLTLALLIPLAIVLMRYINGMRPRWLASVQPGVRWRYLLVCAVVAIAVLNAALWVSLVTRGGVVFHSGQEEWGWFLVAVALTSPLQAAAEEVFFRGYLLQTIGSASGNAWVGVAGSAVVFALLHGVQNPALFAHRLTFGLIAGALVVVTGGLEAGIGAHIVNNLCSYLYAMFMTSVAELKAITSISWAEAGWNIAGFALFAVAAWWLGRRFQVARLTP